MRLTVCCCAQSGEVFVKLLHRIDPEKCPLTILEAPTAEARADQLLGAARAMGIPGMGPVVCTCSPIDASHSVSCNTSTALLHDHRSQSCLSTLTACLAALHMFSSLCCKRMYIARLSACSDARAVLSTNAVVFSMHLTRPVL